MKLADVFFANWQLKLLSLLFAAVLWLFVVLESDDETQLPLTIKLVNVPPGLKLQGVPAARYSLHIAGPRTLLMRQGWRGASVSLDLSGAQAGRVMLSGMDRQVLLISGVRPLRVTPANLEIYLVRE